MRITRRTAALHVAAAGTLLPAAAPLFSPDEQRLLAVLCDLIIPADEFGGALAANVPHYIEVQLRGPLKRFESYYHQGLNAFRLSFPGFEQQPRDAQVVSLQTVEQGKLSQDPRWKRQSARAFFEMVIDHTMQGYYGHPDHGGNRDMVSWRMLGIVPEMSGGHHHPSGGGEA